MTAIVVAAHCHTLSASSSSANHHHDDHDHDDDKMNVFLKMWDGKTLCCVLEPYQEASLSTVVACLEQKVLDSYPGYDRRNFFMELNGKPLSSSSSSSSPSSSTLSEYQHRVLVPLKNSIGSNRSTTTSTVYVHYRNRGGCFMISFTILMTIFFLIITSTCTCGASLLFVPLLLPFLFVLPFCCL